MVSGEEKLKHYWTLWFHKIDDNNWLIDSYQKLYEIHTVKDYCELMCQPN